MRPVTIQLLQASDLNISVTPVISGEPLASITDSIFIVYKTGNNIIEKTLGNGVSFIDGVLTVSIDNYDTENVYGSYKYEWKISVDGEKYFLSYGIFDVLPTKARIL